MFETFRAKAQAVSAEVHRVPAGAQALDLVLAVLGREGVGIAPGERAVWCEGPILGALLDRDALVRRFPGLSFDVTRERAAESRVGITEFEWALAATGTIAQDATDPRLRLASMLPEVHVALFPDLAAAPRPGRPSRAGGSRPGALPGLRHRSEPHRRHRARPHHRRPRSPEARRHRRGRRDRSGVMSAPDLKKRVSDALENGSLAGALGRFNEAYVASRAKAYEGIDFEALRDQLVGLKGRAASHLDELAEQFEEKATQAGATVFRTSDPAEVKRVPGPALQGERGPAHRQVEVDGHRGDAPQRLPRGQGIEVAETDLGEWIVQLAGQRPSHMVMPAIHMSKEQVAGIFSREVKEELAADIPSLVAVARRELRQKFLAADMGITGANVAVAETGTLVVVTNEGNARLVSTLPRIQVAVVGVEKLVERFADVGPILKALPRSATGQLLTSYVSMFTGPAPGADGQPKELHVILLDHRRTAHGARPALRPGAPLHPLRLLRQRLPGLPAARRPRLRRRLHRRHRRHPGDLVRRAQVVEGHPVALHPVRRLHPGLPDAHRHPGDDRRAAPAAGQGGGAPLHPEGRAAHGERPARSSTACSAPPPRPRSPSRRRG